MKRHARKDPVTLETYSYVVARDGYWCVAPSLGAERPCRNRWGDPIYETSGHFTSDDMTLDHVRDQPMMGKRAPSDPDHLVTLCWHHHLGGWATGHRPELREYLRLVGEGRVA